MKISSFKNFSVIFRYIITYLVLLFIPIIITYYILYNDAVELLENDIEKSNLNALSYVRDTIDSYIYEIDNITSSVSSNEDIKPYVMEDLQSDVNEAKKVIRLLNAYCQSSSYIDTIVLYINGQDYLYSNSSTYNADSFLDGFGREIGLTSLQEAHSISSFIPTMQISNRAMDFYSASVMVFNKTLPLGQKKGYGNLFFFIREEALIHSIGGLFENYESETFIVDGGNNILVSDTRDSNLNEYIKNEFSPEIGDKSFRNVVIDGEAYYLSYTISNMVDWRYISLVQADKATDNLYYMKNSLFWTLAIITLIGLAVASAFAFFNYKPLNKIINSMSNDNSKDYHSYNNEFYAIEQAFSDINNMNKNLTKKIEENYDAVLEYYLLNLIKGRYVDDDKILKNISQVGLSFAGPNYFTGILINESLKDRLTDAISADVLKTYLPDTINGGIIEGTRKNRYIMVLSTALKDYSEIISEMTLFKQALNRELSINCSIGLGSVYNKITFAARSYVEADSCIDFRLIKGKNNIIAYNEISNINQSNFRYPDTLLASLNIALNKGDIKQSIDIINKIFESLHGHQLPIYVVKCLCFDIVNTMSKAISRINIAIDDFEKIIPDMIQMSEFDTVEDLNSIIIKMCFDIMPLLQKTENSDNENSLIVRAKNYISQNCHNYDFSIQSMAEYFDVSAPYLSKVFKAKTNTTIIKYVQYYRIEKAKDLLINTDKNLNDIVSEVGYIDTPSFISMFKKNVGLTPGQFKVKYKNN